jgi:hypothetical protein
MGALGRDIEERITMSDSRRVIDTPSPEGARLPEEVPEDPKRYAGTISRRTVLAGAALAAAAAVTAGCTGSGPAGPGAFTLEPVSDRVDVGTATRVPLRWSPSPRATAYDVELNGVVIATGLREPTLDLAYGDDAPGFVEGLNAWRVQANAGTRSRWSDTSRFEVAPLGAVRARRFDHEDDGAIALTTRASSGTTMAVAAAAAFGSGKGLILRGTSPRSAVASKDHHQQALAECWVRLAVRPMQWAGSATRVHLLRVRSSKRASQERLTWSGAHGLSVGSVTGKAVPLPAQRWTQVQMGILADGTVELWSFDGRREHLVGRGSNPELAGAVKDVVALGNDLRSTGSTFEVHLDAFAIGDQRIPWANPNAPADLPRPTRLEPARLPAAFSFCFGSCNNPNQAPYGATAVGTGARLDPDFFVHLGDYC